MQIASAAQPLRLQMIINCKKMDVKTDPRLTTES